ncbi:MAG: uracil-DNA glycosylase [Verrucomicrobiota bacterium]
MASISAALELLGSILSRKKDEGEDTVSLSAKARNTLEEMPMTFHRISQQAPIASPPSALATNEPSTVAAAPAQAEVPEETVAATAPTVTEEVSEFLERIEHREGVEVLIPKGSTPRDQLNNLYREAKAQKINEKLGTLLPTLVFATGNPESDLMFVGEAPGAEEEKQRQPFVGPAGKKLTAIIQAAGVMREDVYISNIVKHRPMIGDGRFQGPKNRKPTPEEMALSAKFIHSEIEVVKPKVIVALGATAAEGLLGACGSVSSMRNRFHDLNGIPVMVTYHPSYLVRLEGGREKERERQEKRKVWEDITMVMDRLGVPLTEKQRGYFS